MSKYAELQQRLTVATERNRTNIERRDELLKQCKEDFDCDSIEELRALAQETKEKLDSVTAELSNAEAKAEQEIASVEDAVAGRVAAGG
jgi:molecular chaperone GrpE (heat shock protein)